MAYIFEHIRTQGFEPLHFEEHFLYLDTLARKLFFAPLAFTQEELQKRISDKLREEGFSPNTENAVYIQYFSDGTLQIEGVDIWYNSFSLRALRPQSHISILSGELLTLNTSVKASLLEFNRSTAHTSDRGVAIWANEQGEVVAIDGAPVIAVFEDEIRFSQFGIGVEFDLAYVAAEKMRRNVTKEKIMVDELGDAKELLYIDYRGITALEGFEQHRYMDITAEKIAAEIAAGERS